MPPRLSAGNGYPVLMSTPGGTMPIAIDYNPTVDPYLSWQAENGAAFCNRMSAIITAATCESNQQKTGNDCRCNGCAGLYSQAPMPQPKQFIMVWDADEKTETESDPPSGSASSESKNDSFADLDEIIDRLYDDPETDDDFDDLVVDLDDEQLLALFPELARDTDENADTEINFPRFSEYQKGVKPRAIYKGRCKRCNGYMTDIRERDDDNVFHCLACGWYTGVIYESNRAMNGVRP